MPILRLPAKIESFEALRSFIIEEIKRRGVIGELIPPVDLVLEEVLVNVINYAYPGADGDVEVECASDGPGTFRLTIRDWGAPFNPIEQADPDLSTDIAERRAGGLGIFLVKRMTNRLHYEYTGGANVLTAWFEN